MFDSVAAVVDGPGVDAAAVLELAAGNFRARTQESCAQLLVAALWADLHSGRGPGQAAGGGLPGGERLKETGGEGTPDMLEFAAAELGAVQHTTTTAARNLIADALDVRHRFPRLWVKVKAGVFGVDGRGRSPKTPGISARKHAGPLMPP
jgi:hypothetical protein